MSSDDSQNDSKSDPQRYRVLIEFAHRHLDFLLAELESVLAMNGIILGDDECYLVTLLHQDRFNELVQLRADCDPLQKLSKRPFALLSFSPNSPWATCCRSQQQQQQAITTGKPSIGEIILDRCVLVRSVIELWAMAPTLEDCAEAVQHWKSDTNLGREIWEGQKDPSRSWKFTIQTLGTTFTREEHESMRNQFSFLDLPGPVKMKDVDDEYILIREVELDHKGGPVYPRHDFQKKLIPENDLRPPLAWYFGRVISGARTVKGRGKIGDYTLKNRVYLGPTSMDTELSFVMTNFGHVRHGSIVFDPFVGTGSILISCALRGAYCIGTDIDIRVLRGKNSSENVYSNFRQYNLPRPELIRSDTAMYDRHFRSSVPLYDAIVCDPPYGIRAGARKTGARHEDDVRKLSDSERIDHIPQTIAYPVSDVMADLLDLAAATLVMGGRLVYIIPSYADFDPESDLPRHPCLKVVHICYQPLSLELGRSIVAMEKIQEYDKTRKDEYLKFVWKNGLASADKCANIRAKINEAAKQKPGYEEKLAIRKKKRLQNKEAKKKTKIKRGQESNDGLHY